MSSTANARWPKLREGAIRASSSPLQFQVSSSSGSPGAVARKTSVNFPLGTSLRRVSTSPSSWKKARVFSRDETRSIECRKRGPLPSGFRWRKLRESTPKTGGTPSARVHADVPAASATHAAAPPSRRRGAEVARRRSIADGERSGGR
eukprot:scaffold202186_cov35-Tisochrysis_lutea.AAC.1